MSNLIKSQGPLLALTGLVVIFSVFSESFASMANFAAVLEAAAIPAIVAIGLTYVLMQASIDLSVEGVASLANIILSITVANSVTTTDIGLWAIPLVLCAGLLVGATSAAVSIYVRMPSLIVTLGMWLTTVGMAALLFPDRLPQLLETRITQLAIDKQFGLSWIVYLTLALILVALWVEKYTRFGRMSRAIGENEPVLIMSGIKVNRHKIAAFALAGGCYALAGILLGARIGVGNTQSGVGLLFPAIAACVLGGTLLSGGQGGIRQSMIGVLILVSLRNGLIQIGVDPLLQSALEGAVIIIAVAGSTWHLRRKVRVIK
ncbi:ABC transporter permease [Cypionkella sp.]|uniref:ABC transporter permease n=1 Tax=Cypionkella sp. TaxID=2811411 RepID=UPI0027166C84|nr:ABC transporter permease [Cypionkella sp.]MDO8986191.1 ABC transporter permease [Cypionkella sp.]MDP2050375.1 ABC transporter permease [Cypionkella sp.]